MTPCAKCGREMSMVEARAGDVPLCHPNSGPDCYRLVTVYGHFVAGYGTWDGAKGWAQTYE